MATLPKVDSHLRALRIRLSTGTVTPRQRVSIWHDINELLEARLTRETR